MSLSRDTGGSQCRSFAILCPSTSVQVDELGHYVKDFGCFYQLAHPPGRHVDHILDEGRHAQVVVHNDQPPLAVVN